MAFCFFSNKERELVKEANKLLCQHKYTNKVACEIYGHIRYLSEAEVRALQVLAKRAADTSEDAFNDFTQNVVVYSARTKRSSKHKMIFRKDGKFSNDFEGGFFSTCANLAFEIM